MNIVALILFIVSAVLFAVAAISPAAPATRLVGAGAALLTVGLIVQFGAKSHSVTF